MECCRCYTVLLSELMDDDQGNLYCLECYQGAMDEKEQENQPLNEVDVPSNRWPEDVEESIVNPAKEKWE